MRQRHAFVRCILVFAIFALATPACATQGQIHTWWKVSFSTPLVFSEPQEVGLDAVALLMPADATLGTSRLEITLVAIPRDMREGMGMQDDAQLAAYVKSTFLGTTKPAERIEKRTFMENAIDGGVQSLKIPRKSELTFFLIPLSRENTIALALVRDAAVPAEEAESVLAMISKTFKELEE